MTVEMLRTQRCEPRKGPDAGLAPEAIAGYPKGFPGWSLAADGGAISKEFRFEDYFHTMAFVNAVASIAHREDHHPDLEVGYSRCRVSYSTHDVGGISINDFICAAKVEELVTGAV